MNSLVEVDFHGAKLVALKGAAPADTLVAMKPVVEGMGLDWSSQHAKVMRHPVLSKGIQHIAIPSAGGIQETTAIPLNRLSLWLATVHPDKVRSSVRAKVIEYQEECADVLFAHFFAKAGGGEASELARRTDGISRMLAHKVTGMEKELLELASVVRALVVTNDPRIAAVDAMPALQIAIEANVPKKGRRPIVRAISNSLARYCEARGHVIRRDIRGTKLFAVHAVHEWRLSGGDAEICKLVSANASAGPLFDVISGGKSA